ncbi:hypothetical protein Tco_0901431 [Tanacetum coccineum]
MTFQNGTSPKRPQRDQKAFVGGSWSDSKEEEEVKKDESCLMAHESNEVCIKVDLELGEWIKDSGDIIDNLLNNDPIPDYERLTFDMEPNVLVISNVNEDECFDPGGGKINVEVDDSFTFVTRTFLPYLTHP